MRICEWTKDGGSESTVWGFYVVEFKSLFSIVLLRFDHGSREAFHSHAFHALSWLLSGKLYEYVVVDKYPSQPYCIEHAPSWKPIWTPRERFHRVVSSGRSWALTFRGPWVERWREAARGRQYFLTHGRQEVR